MSEDGGYTQQLASALEQRGEQLEEKVLLEVKENFRTFHAAYQGLFNILQRKGLIGEDPYKNDQKISEVAPPPDDPFLESEKDQKMSVRLSAFDNMLDYLTNYFEFSLDNIDLKQVKNLVGLTNYIKWSNLSEASPKYTTRALAEYAGKLRSETDPLSGNLVKDSVEQLTKMQQSILRHLKQIADYKKEEYKLFLREEIIPHSDLSEAQAYHQKDRSIRSIRKAFQERGAGRPFFQELVDEVINEDFGPDGHALRQEVLSHLQVREEKPKQKQKQDELRPILMEGIRNLPAAGRSIEEILNKIDENVGLLDNRKKSFGERFREWIDRMVNRDTPKRVFEVEYLDDATSTTHTERIEYESFTTSMRKKARLYGAIPNRMSNVGRKLEDASEDQLYNFLQKHLEALAIAQRQLQSLDTHIRAEAPRAQRNSLNGVADELAQLKETTAKANKKKHAYVSKKEEQEQFRKLGIQEER
jgi:hypothetical protein